jgi:hypothetical protein
MSQDGIDGGGARRAWRMMAWAVGLGWVVAGCDEGRVGEGAGRGEGAEERQILLLEGERAGLWEGTAIPGAGAVEIVDGVMRLGAGMPMTGVRYGGELGVDLGDYEIRLEARRVEGTDFFCALTFPVGTEESCVSLIVGGWGGGLVGISSLDWMDASENGTASLHEFEEGEWYVVRVRVSGGELVVWLGDKLVVREQIVGRQLGLRAGDIEGCAPFGLATFGTVGEVRGLVLSP